MPFITCHMSISLDGLVAGPDQRGQPIGIDGRKPRLAPQRSETRSTSFHQRLLGPRKGYIMGKHVRPGSRCGRLRWRGWWVLSAIPSCSY
jgi:hypothetical protein